MNEQNILKVQSERLSTFQAVCKDRLFPYISVFAKGYGKDDEPRRAYGLAFGVAMLMILIGALISTEL